MTNKEKYQSFCQQNADMPIFMQPWWMDAVCAGKQWDVLLKEDAEGNIEAAMPYLLRKRIGLKYVLMPQQTQIGGIYIHHSIDQTAEKCKEIGQYYAEQIKVLKLSYYYQQYPIGSVVAEQFRDLGFSVSKRITYRIDDLSDMNALLNSFSKNKKRQLQKALTLQSDSEMSAEEFYRFHNSCLSKRRKKITYTREFFLVLYQKAVRHNQGKIIRIADSKGTTYAAAFLVWDSNTLYYLIPCFDDDHKESGASALLAWEAIKQAEKQGLQFDFKGSMIRGVANHYKQFASTPTTYYSVRKYYNPLFVFALLFNKLRN